MVTFNAFDAFVVKDRGVVFTGEIDQHFDSGDACAEFYIGKMVRIRLMTPWGEVRSEFDIRCVGVERNARLGPFRHGEKIGLLAGKMPEVEN